MQTIGQLMYVDGSTQALQVLGVLGVLEGALLALVLIFMVIVVILAVRLRVVAKRKTSRIDARNNLNLQK